jgi:CRP-like cAMP-binding protein
METDFGHGFDANAYLAKVGEGKTVHEHGANHIIYPQGVSADAVFFIQKGRIKITVLSDGGKEAVLAILGKGDFFGEGCLNNQPLRVSAAITMTDCSLMRIAKSAMIRLLHEEPQFSERFIVFLLSRNSQIEEDLADQLFNTSEKRLARVLLRLANFGKNGKLEPIVPKINQETLAEMVGTTRSRVNTFMNKFRRLGLIDYSGDRLEVHDSLVNIVLHD